MSKHPLPPPTASAIGPCPTIIHPNKKDAPALKVYPAAPSHHPTTPLYLRGNWNVFSEDIKIKHISWSARSYAYIKPGHCAISIFTERPVKVLAIVHDFYCKWPVPFYLLRRLINTSCSHKGLQSINPVEILGWLVRNKSFAAVVQCV